MDHEVSISLPPKPVHRILDSNFKSGHGFQLGRHLPVELIQDVTDRTPAAGAVSTVWKGMGMKTKLVLLGCLRLGLRGDGRVSGRPRTLGKPFRARSDCRTVPSRQSVLDV